MFRKRLQWSIVPAAWLLAGASFAQDLPRALPLVPDAQSGNSELSVVGVLEMAKTAAEQAKNERARIQLRSRVAASMERTGQIAMFGSYFSDTARASEGSAFGYLPPHVREVIKANRALDVEAKRAFLSGNPEGAKQYLRQCQFVPHYDFCPTFDLDFNIRFLHWEIKAGDLTAALHRLRTVDWKNDYLRRLETMHVARAYVVAGRRTEAMDILRDARPLGPDPDSCIVENGETGLAAKLRQLACGGQAKAAVEMAMALSDVTTRTLALVVVAEGLAGIPGVSDEQLEL